MRLPGPGRREQRCVLRWSTKKSKQEAREALPSTRLLEPHCFILSYGNAAKGWTQAAQAAAHSWSAHVPLDERWRPNIQGAQGRAREPARRLRLRRA
eukprot:5718701-Pleurochrysis_carterae.AAC.1